MASWTYTDPSWARLTPEQQAAAMAFYEASKYDDARNVASAMINRSKLMGHDLGAHVSNVYGPNDYQPANERSRQAELKGILERPDFPQMVEFVKQRQSGAVPDPVRGATHFLEPYEKMRAHEQREPSKYRDWGPRGSNWTGADEAKGEYSHEVGRDSTHSFLIPADMQARYKMSPEQMAERRKAFKEELTAQAPASGAPAPAAVAPAPEGTPPQPEPRKRLGSEHSVLRFVSDLYYGDGNNGQQPVQQGGAPEMLGFLTSLLGGAGGGAAAGGAAAGGAGGGGGLLGGLLGGMGGGQSGGKSKGLAEGAMNSAAEAAKIQPMPVAPLVPIESAPVNWSQLAQGFRGQQGFGGYLR